ncbi:Gfo/Idh/MocA family oxidoreductase [Ancylobacter dichloromethanicus]|uniref:Dehydrogenase n=1 Tax=Ancylobacter dichloromethanicus TaxID=518825 RepID=A0A9W6J5W9_9HYPH|nr:Gfo/Idh/MocA family oxidoreductase [Ancylobacter dichloromethanicus]MBS7554305.1 Gfo/Idh/MocA family oxidoreductase [Ancylobacter dichloromethanicus]GLK71430.1 dehydrogenase [Ancylobacter dichloromethanicus]
MSAIRLALVGLGKIARDQHLPAIAATPGIELVAVASRSATLDGVAHFATLADLLASGEAIDAVALCTPPQGRRELAGMALSAGKHVLLEKPPGATVSELGPLVAAAQERGRTLFATWHSRFAPAVEPARAFLSEVPPRAVRVTWKEDVRVWHPGQRWIWEPGGLGVFDPAINALSILTAILPRPVFITSAGLDFPSNCAAPIAATLALADAGGLPVRAELDFLQTGPQSWDIVVETDRGTLTLAQGGAVLSLDGQVLSALPETEYRNIYKHFVELVAAGRSDVDLAPLQLVADAFLLGRRTLVAPFHE